ncbi:hypothetical protein Pst134EA_024352 [Puccinia striiformis f. sp. tritici]|uniref:Uncharacterized protein n=1 Tax=Puccinia striiformis f. sp. tritici PST-78 TaxID=1165861 RepID=A0A0L0VDG5_9BASI|nr:hypothetical protein Pst134EA_024352 [Puccinia striiformis f. sp. tritici]KAH9453481.1 hypothetical protein Pst134EA_024352 [Puccinia striiformis f. sp. tritici]KNE97335.1 hypothetical protein PSTG_09446 [Puccinia striiformis f. sp. tritici PST-78]
MDHLTFDKAVIDNSLPPDLTPGNSATFKEINDIRSDNVAGVVEDDASMCDSTYGSDLGCDPFADAPLSP